MSDSEKAPTLDPATERQVAVDLFNYTWTLIDKPDRTPDDDAEMVHATHASCLHWLRVGRPVHAARGEWQISRVYSVLGRGEPAVYHAQRVLDICEREGIGDWDLAFAYEALARAHAVAGNRDEATRWLEKGRAAAAEVAEEEDRELVLSDLATVPI